MNSHRRVAVNAVESLEMQALREKWEAVRARVLAEKQTKAHPDRKPTGYPWGAWGNPR